MSQALYRILGNEGSPYSLKVRAAFRYRRIPHVFERINMFSDPDLQKMKVKVIPVVVDPEGNARNDSTPVLQDLDALVTGRELLPPDPVQRFLAILVEDFADEWLTKIMFRYRWQDERDQRILGTWLAYDTLGSAGRDLLDDMGRNFSSRQTGRFAVVGCQDDNVALIHSSYLELLDIFEDMAAKQDFLFGSRPSIADFAIFGQMSQLASDPGPADIMLDRAPLAKRYWTNMDDLSGIAIGEWMEDAALPNTALKAILTMINDIYLPFLDANARAVASGGDRFTVSLRGHDHSQAVFRYQARCQQILQQAYRDLPVESQAVVDSFLPDHVFAETV